MNVFDELKNCKDFVYIIENKYYIIGSNYYFKCPNNIKIIYDNFIQLAKDLKITLKTPSPSKEIFDDCMNLFEKLTSSIAKTISSANYNDNYYKIISNLDYILNENEKLKIKNQKKLFTLFDDLLFKYKRKEKFKIYPNNLKELEKIDL